VDQRQHIGKVAKLVPNSFPLSSEWHQCPRRFVVDQRIGMFVPAGTSPEIVARLNTEVNAALNDERVRRTFTDQAQEAAGGTAEHYANLVHEDSEKYARLVKELNVTVDKEN
jgi:hypothetical protein